MKPAVISLLAGPAASKLARLQRELSTQLQLDGPLGRDPEDWIDALDAILTVRLPGQELDCVIARALDEAAARACLLRAAELSEAVGISPRHLRRLFRSWVGLSPKQALRILRFQSTLRQVSSRLTSPAEAAAASGYFDQSHLARESARLAQVTPGRLISSQVADFSKTICQLSPKFGE